MIRFSLVCGPDLGANLRHGVVVHLGLLGDGLHHLREILALALGTFGPFLGHFELLGEGLHHITADGELPLRHDGRRRWRLAFAVVLGMPMLAHRRAAPGLGVAKLATVFKVSGPGLSGIAKCLLAAARQAGAPSVDLVPMGLGRVKTL